MVYFVRTAGPKDVDQVHKLLIETFHSTYDGIYGAETVEKLLQSWNSPAAITERIGRKGGEYVVADSGRDIGGMGFAAPYAKMDKTVMLHQLYVKPSAQGDGVGRDIFAELETCFPDAEIMRVEVALQNERAISFYSRLGFVEVDRMEEFGGPNSGLPAVVMEKRLPQ
ncbi:GNAT family N-acetyltransferase [Rhizobiales bacterium RZME27]|uniref:GNAT family N-acetyltransferase n=1 Tax=Endobacterium cereale TaxID=2663029 RepID=A0A6A8AAM9_9HYPH|nr:GNAT family N-acetyltransferase [Endobacterium cereale]MEB2846052.1 GNAT family N-acetyltransferase [Endobacterium cereale]MQY48262.1 GNAT family N-acetyltransferase [Endobacterium cereale]